VFKNRQNNAKLHVLILETPESHSFWRVTYVKKKVKRKKQQRPVPSDAEILNADEAAKVVGVSKQLLLKLARAGELPGRKLGREWRCHRTTLRKWVAGESEADALIAAMRAGGAKISRQGR